MEGKLHLYAISGRVIVDDNDTVEVVAAASEAEAIEPFVARLNAGPAVPFVSATHIGEFLPNGLLRVDASHGGIPPVIYQPLDWNVIGASMRKHDISGDIAPLETESQFLARIIDELVGRSGPAADPMAAAIERVIMQCGGDQWKSCGEYPREDWRLDVENGDTNIGYWEWVIHQAESNEVDLATLDAE